MKRERANLEKKVGRRRDVDGDGDSATATNRRLLASVVEKSVFFVITNMPPSNRPMLLDEIPRDRLDSS